MCINNRSRLFLVKLEAVAGVAETPVIGTDDCFVMFADSPGISEGIEVSQVSAASPSGNDYPDVVTARKPTADITVPLYGKGKTSPGGVVVLPAWSRILQTAGHWDLSTGGGAEARWTPDIVNTRFTDDAGVTTNASRTFTLWELTGRLGNIASGTKTLRAMRGCRLQQAVFSLGPQGIIRVAYKIVGMAVDTASTTLDMALANLDGMTTDLIPGNGAASQLTFPGPNVENADPTDTQWTLDFGMEHIAGDTDGSGVVCVEGDYTKLTGTIDPLVREAASINRYATAVRNQQVLAYAYGTAAGGVFPQGRTTGTGYGIKFAVPSVQLIGDEDPQGKVKRRTLTAKASGGPIAPLCTLTIL
jgi:hypothetical protein